MVSHFLATTIVLTKKRMWRFTNQLLKWILMYLLLLLQLLRQLNRHRHPPSAFPLLRDKSRTTWKMTQKPKCQRANGFLPAATAFWNGMHMLLILKSESQQWQQQQRCGQLRTNNNNNDNSNNTYRKDYTGIMFYFKVDWLHVTRFSVSLGHACLVSVKSTYPATLWDGRETVADELMRFVFWVNGWNFEKKIGTDKIWKSKYKIISLIWSRNYKSK